MTRLIRLLVPVAAALAVVTGCTPAPSFEPPTTASPTSVPSATTEAAPTHAPTTTPTPTAAWPTALDEQTAMERSGTYSVVWLSTAPEGQTDALDAVQERAEELGYASAGTPVGCVAPAPADLLDPDDPSSTWGAPLYFAAASDAELFVALWGDPVAAVVHDVHLACDWG